MALTFSFAAIVNIHAQGIEILYSNGSTKIISGEDLESIVPYTYSDEINTNGHKYVDLGLPSGTLWADGNIDPLKYSTINYDGSFFAFGETKTKNQYDLAEYKQKTAPYLQKKYFDNNNLKVLEPEDDAAHVKWGGVWRIPTYEEWQELINYCSCTLQTYSNVKGLEFKSKKNGRTIFFPFTGNMTKSLGGQGYQAYYACSTINRERNKPTTCYSCYMHQSAVARLESEDSSVGCPVRPVFCPNTESRGLIIYKKMAVMKNYLIVICLKLKYIITKSNCLL